MLKPVQHDNKLASEVTLLLSLDRQSRNDYGCHCEEQRDEAISSV